MLKVSVLLIILLASVLASSWMACQITEPPSAPAQRTVVMENSVPVSAFIHPPQDIQEFVNRVDAVIIGTIAAVSGPFDELPDGKTAADYQWATDRGLPLPTMRQVYYDINIEEVLLDDGNIRSHPRLRLSGNHSPIRPQVEERFMFALGANYGGQSYGVSDNWHLVFLDNRPIRNFDGEQPSYTGVTNEASLKTAVLAAVPNRIHLPPEQWPRITFNENAPAETPAAPGGPAPGGSGPTGNANN